jgi:ATP-dependent helicase HrpA
VFDEPEVAAAKHRAGLRRLFALQLKDALKYLEKNIPDLQKMAVAYMPLGTQEELRDADHRRGARPRLPAGSAAHEAADFKRRLDEGRGRLTLIANEVARLAPPPSSSTTPRPSQDQGHEDPAGGHGRTPRSSCSGCAQALPPIRPWTQLQHLPRYLKAIVLRLDKLRADPARDAAAGRTAPAGAALLAPGGRAQGRGRRRMLEFRWLLEELRVSFFAQELRTPQPVSVKRLDKAWAQLQA